MAHLSVRQGINLINKGICSYIANRPLVVSYEVTLSCNCSCHHCDLGGIRKEEERLHPSDYADLTRLLKPTAVQISGGEPLLRKDIVAIVQAIKQSDGLPYSILVSNGSLLNRNNYLQLCEAGVNKFSISLDFPDERHDEFRRRPGLYKHLEQTIPELANFGYRNIILNSVITRANLKEILPLAEKARDWGVSLSYSAYTPMRTGSKDYCIDTEEGLRTLRQSIKEVIEWKKRSKNIANSKAILLSTLRFLEQGYMPNCKAGIRFLVVMPDGSFIPCSHHRNKYSTQKEMVEKFSRSNQCDGCYVAIRSYSEPSLWGQLKSITGYAKQVLAKA